MVANATNEILTFGTVDFSNNDSYSQDRTIWFKRNTILIHNGYLYAHSSIEHTPSDYVIYKINITNASDVTACRVVNGFTPRSTGSMPRCMMLWGDRFILLEEKDNRPRCVLSIDDNTIYEDSQPDEMFGAGTYSGCYTYATFVPVFGSIYSYLTRYDKRTGSPWEILAVRCPGYFATRRDLPITINNLSNPILKTNAQTLKITYTLTDVETSSI